MVFKDRKDAGKELAEIIIKDPLIQKSPRQLVVLSLMRGGAPAGHEVAKKLNCKHHPLFVQKISAPGQKELAIGAVCEGHVFINTPLVKRLKLNKKQIEQQVRGAQEKLKGYIKQFKIKKPFIEDKVVIVVDDGIATGSSVFAACRCLRQKHTNKVYLATPVAPEEFQPNKDIFNGDSCFDKVFILHKEPRFFSVSQFYRYFPQLSDQQALSYFKT
ncbi:MAG: phosphoribosyltransferase [Candidatus Paceibacterota bacterium]